MNATHQNPGSNCIAHLKLESLRRRACYLGSRFLSPTSSESGLNFSFVLELLRLLRSLPRLKRVHPLPIRGWGL
jgi:hypothetical protein